MTVSGNSERLRVELGDRSYDIVIGPGLIVRAGAEILSLMRRRQAIFITDRIVAAHRLRPLFSSFDEPCIARREIILTAGEGTKGLAHLGGPVDDFPAC